MLSNLIFTRLYKFRKYGTVNKPPNQLFLKAEYNKRASNQELSGIGNVGQRCPQRISHLFTL